MLSSWCQLTWKRTEPILSFTNWSCGRTVSLVHDLLTPDIIKCLAQCQQRMLKNASFVRNELRHFSSVCNKSSKHNLFFFLCMQRKQLVYKQRCVHKQSGVRDIFEISNKQWLNDFTRKLEGRSWWGQEDHLLKGRLRPWVFAMSLGKHVCGVCGKIWYPTVYTHGVVCKQVFIVCTAGFQENAYSHHILSYCSAWSTSLAQTICIPCPVPCRFLAWWAWIRIVGPVQFQ